MHILIVDDHEPFREGLVELLHDRFQDVTVLQADSVASACKVTRQYHRSVDLVLLDHELPDGLGVNLLARMRLEYPHLAIAILSAWEDAELMQHALQLGALGYIPKNTSTPVMLSAIQLILSGGVYVPPCLLSYMPPDISKMMKIAEEKTHLTDRQLEVLSLLRSGLSNKGIARKLSISEATVKAHVTTILRVCGVSSRTQLQGGRKSVF